MQIAVGWVRDPEGTVTEVSGEGPDWDAAKAAVAVPEGCQVIAWVNPDR